MRCQLSSTNLRWSLILTYSATSLLFLKVFYMMATSMFIRITKMYRDAMTKKNRRMIR
jgi:hypothetical protein